MAFKIERQPPRKLRAMPITHALLHRQNKEG